MGNDTGSVLEDEIEPGLPPLVTACMGCGERRPLLPQLAMADSGWKYVFEYGWFCPRCTKRDLGRRGPGGPPLDGTEYWIDTSTKPRRYRRKRPRDMP